MTQASARARRARASPQNKAAKSTGGSDGHHSVAELARALTTLKANTDELLQRKRQLQQLNRLFDVALNNMGRGLSMFDAEQRLIVCNNLYREIYDLPKRLTRPGTPFSRIVRDHVKQQKGCEDAAEIHRQCEWIEGHVAKLARGETFTYTQWLANGRIVEVSNQPLAGGGWVDIQEDITERRKAEQRITWLAHHDPLTETANRMYFSKELQHALKQISTGSGFALHWIDLDHFKNVNDRLGHPAGDRLLKSIAERLCRTVREQDLVARLGGDEFAIIQAGARDEKEAEELSRRLLSAVDRPHRVLRHDIKIGASIGIALAPEHGSEAEQLMKNVDVALYRAKSAGRGTYAMFQPTQGLAGGQS